MVIVTGRRTARALPWLRLLALLPISLLVGHEAVFAAQYGSGDAFLRAMSAGGHDGYWQAFSLVITVLTGALLSREGLRATRLRWRLRGTRAAPRIPAGQAAAHHGSRRREFQSIWPLLFAATAVAFGVLENVEHVVAGQAPHGLGSLIGTEHPLAVPILAFVTAVAAAAGALIRWRVQVLELRVARAGHAGSRGRHAHASAPARDWPAAGALRVHAWFLVRQDAGRAPPFVA